MQHPLLGRERPAKAGLLVFTSDRGLAGAYNANVLKVAEGLMRDVRGRGPRARALRRREEGDRVLPVPRRPDAADLAGVQRGPAVRGSQRIGRTLIQDFADEEIDELHAAYTDFRSAFTMRATSQRFLPIAEEVTGKGLGIVHAEYLFEPEPADPRPPPAAVRGDQGVRRAAGVGGVGERVTAAC